MRYYEGKLNAKSLKIAIISAKFNSFIGDKLIDGARNAFEQYGGDEKDITVVKVPGSFEIPGAVRKLSAGGQYNAFICLGVIIRGQTPHFEYVASSSAKAIMELAAEGKVPVINGIITADDLDQAIDRAGTKSGNKGYDAMSAAVEMANLYQQIQG